MPFESPAMNPLLRRLAPAIVLASLLAACSKAPDTSLVTQSLTLPPEGSVASVADGGAVAAAASSSSGNTASTSVPAATDEVWKALDRQAAALQKAVDGGVWKDVPASADAIRDLTAALPAHAAKLSADDQQMLQQQVTLVATYVGKLDEAASAGNAAGVKANFKRLNDTLGGITRFP